MAFCSPSSAVDANNNGSENPPGHRVNRQVRQTSDRCRSFTPAVNQGRTQVVPGQRFYGRNLRSRTVTEDYSKNHQSNPRRRLSAETSGSLSRESECLHSSQSNYSVSGWQYQPGDILSSSISHSSASLEFTDDDDVEYNITPLSHSHSSRSDITELKDIMRAMQQSLNTNLSDLQCQISKLVDRITAVEQRQEAIDLDSSMSSDSSTSSLSHIRGSRKRRSPPELQVQLVTTQDLFNTKFISSFSMKFALYIIHFHHQRKLDQMRGI